MAIEHSCVVSYFFHDGYKEIIGEHEQVREFYADPGPTVKMYRKMDAGYTYDLLRHYHPEEAHRWLSVRVLPQRMMNTADRHKVYADRVSLKPLEVRRGLAPLYHCNWLGERPMIPGSAEAGWVSVDGYVGQDLEAFAKELEVKLGALVSLGLGKLLEAA